MLRRMLVEVLVISVGCFVAALVNAAVATGGVYIMLAASSAVLPLAAAIPMQSALGAPSLAARIVIEWRGLGRPPLARFLLWLPLRTLPPAAPRACAFARARRRAVRGGRGP